MDDKDGKFCGNHYLHTKYLWNLSFGIYPTATGNKVGIKRLTFLDVLFLKDHSGSRIENWLEVRQEAGNIEEQVKDSDDFLNEGSVFGATEEINTFK